MMIQVDDQKKTFTEKDHLIAVEANYLESPGQKVDDQKRSKILNRLSNHPYLSKLHQDTLELLNEIQFNALFELQNEFDLESERLKLIVEKFVKEFRLGLETIIDPNEVEDDDDDEDIKTKFEALKVKKQEDRDQELAQINKPLNQNGSVNHHHLLPMLPTFIHDVPTGEEEGIFLALDLGGTNLRVCEVNLNGDKTFKIKSDKYLLTDQLKTGKAEDLFDYIAECVQNFLLSIGHQLHRHCQQEQPQAQNENKDDGEEEIYLGFTFSFPVLQTALDQGKLIDWTKGFKASGAVGVDVVKLLQNSLDKKKLPVKCNALANDTVGTLMTRAYQSGSALIGAIFGTGTNAAYVENLSSVKKLNLNSPKFKNLNKMIINTEWGAFDNLRNVLPVTKYDNKLDRESINPRKQTFEKMISGMYLGELTRNVIVDMIDRGIIFKGHSSLKLNQHYGFDTSLMSQIDGGGLTVILQEDNLKDEDHDQRKINLEKKLETIKQLFKSNFDLDQDFTHDQISDWILIERICEIVSTRAARLSAVAIATIIRQTKSDDLINQDDKIISIGVDGSLIERYQSFLNRILIGLSHLFPPSIFNKIQIKLAKDGSGVGAALCSLQAKKQSLLSSSSSSSST